MQHYVGPLLGGQYVAEFWGGGLAVNLVDTATGRAAFVQGDSAACVEAFMRQWEEAEGEGFDTPQNLRAMAEEYLDALGEGISQDCWERLAQAGIHRPGLEG